MKLTLMPNWLKRFGKYALLAYIAYNVIELAIVLICFPDFIPNLLQGKITTF